MINYDFGLILIYIAGFGYSDLIVEHFNLEGKFNLKQNIGNFIH